ncbi:MAG: SufE family protein [Candidatus Competibacteraceae bacterium]|nr:SufE family protein [Candidatus Competibacteraceae bacterium]
MSIDTLQNEIIEEFELFDDWMDKYEHIVEMGKNLPVINTEMKTDEHLIDGCQSKVWLAARLEDGKVHFTADSDAIITKGIVSLLIRVLSNHSPAEILNTDLYMIDRIGLATHLSPTRSNGLLSMINKMKSYAKAFIH